VNAALVPDLGRSGNLQAVDAVREAADSISAQPTVFRGHCEVFRLRTSRWHRRCDYSRDTTWFHPCSGIAPGQRYIHVTIYPGHDYVSVEKPSTGSCCLGCASGYSGMGELVPAAFQPRPTRVLTRQAAYNPCEGPSDPTPIIL
jgi:hypothetical protein